MFWCYAPHFCIHSRVRGAECMFTLISNSKTIIRSFNMHDYMWILHLHVTHFSHFFSIYCPWHEVRSCNTDSGQVYFFKHSLIIAKTHIFVFEPKNNVTEDYEPIQCCRGYGCAKYCISVCINESCNNFTILVGYIFSFNFLNNGSNHGN